METTNTATNNAAKQGENAMKFNVGQTYETRAIGDHNCVYSFKVQKRTAKTVTITGSLIAGYGRRTIKIDDDGSEYVFPTGQHSFAPIIRANR